MRSKFFPLSLLFIVIFLPSYLFSQQQYLDVDDIKKEWKDFTSFQRQELINYTMFLYNEGFYERALLGYFQYLYKYPQDELESAAYYQIGKCYEKMENWDLAKNYYNRLINSSDVKSSDSNAAKYQILYINFKNRMFDEILLQTDQTKDPYQLIFRAYAHFEKLEWEDSKKAFQSAESIFDHGHYSTRAYVSDCESGIVGSTWSSTLLPRLTRSMNSAVRGAQKTVESPTIAPPDHA